MSDVFSPSKGNTRNVKKLEERKTDPLSLEGYVSSASLTKPPEKGKGGCPQRPSPGIESTSGKHSLLSAQRSICTEFRDSHPTLHRALELPRGTHLPHRQCVLQSGKPSPSNEPQCDLTCALPRATPVVGALCTVPFSSFVDDTVTSSTSESSALSKKRFTLQGFANLKGQKGKRHLPKIVFWTCASLWWHVCHPSVW